MFIDEAEIQVRSGKGGDGVVHFRREKYVARGGPDGGDGGRGGDVVLQVATKLNTLYAFRHKRHFRADDGNRGGSNNKTGRSGTNCIIEVPAGTVIFDADTKEVLGDLTESGQQLIVCQGGRGGRGNTRFASSRNKAPRLAEKGEPGEERTLHLELKLIADVGIVGVPNAGKSTLLAAVTNAKPKIASYPFTTLVPNLGVVELDYDTTLILADIPGLIEGAHTGVGLGHDFLRHVQRTRVLIHLLDGLGDDPLADFSQINSELALFDPQLADKPQIVVLNKIDMPEVLERSDEIEGQLRDLGYESMSISALARTNVRQLLFRTKELLEKSPKPPDVAALPIYRPAEDPQEFGIEQTPDGWRVHGASIERAAAMTYWEYEQSVRRFQRILETIGVDEALREAGIQHGDTVFIADHELEWQD